MNPQEGAAELPDGIEMRIDVFVVSPSTGLEAKVGMAGIRSMRAFETLAGDPEAVIKSVRRMTHEIADDFRPMSRAEIEDYKRRQEEGEDEGDDEEEG